MKTLTLTFICTFSLLAIGCRPAMDQYGESMLLDEVTPIQAVLADPASYVGKKIQIEGKISDVCPMKGCWIEIVSDDGQKSLMVKVNDDEIVFKKESIGKHAIAEGEVYSIDLNREEAISYMQHLAEEKGESFDSTSVAGPMVIYQVKGVGALVEKKETRGYHLSSHNRERPTHLLWPGSLTTRGKKNSAPGERLTRRLRPGQMEQDCSRWLPGVRQAHGTGKQPTKH